MIEHNLSDELPPQDKYHSPSEVYGWEDTGLGLEEVWYVYYAASYEGDGAAVLKRFNEDKQEYEWALMRLCHCSCYDSLDRKNLPDDGEWHPSIDDVDFYDWPEAEFLVNKAKECA